MDFEKYDDIFFPSLVELDLFWEKKSKMLKFTARPMDGHPPKSDQKSPFELHFVNVSDEV